MKVYFPLFDQANMYSVDTLSEDSWTREELCTKSVYGYKMRRTKTLRAIERHSVTLFILKIAWKKHIIPLWLLGHRLHWGCKENKQENTYFIELAHVWLSFLFNAYWCACAHILKAEIASLYINGKEYSRGWKQRLYSRWKGYNSFYHCPRISPMLGQTCFIGNFQMDLRQQAAENKVKRSLICSISSQ